MRPSCGRCAPGLAGGLGRAGVRNVLEPEKRRTRDTLSGWRDEGKMRRVSRLDAMTTRSGSTDVVTRVIPDPHGRPRLPPSAGPWVCNVTRYGIYFPPEIPRSAAIPASSAERGPRVRTKVDTGPRMREENRSSGRVVMASTGGRGASSCQEPFSRTFAAVGNRPAGLKLLPERFRSDLRSLSEHGRLHFAVSGLRRKTANLVAAVAEIVGGLGS